MHSEVHDCWRPNCLFSKRHLHSGCKSQSCIRLMALASKKSHSDQPYDVWRLYSHRESGCCDDDDDDDDDYEVVREERGSSSKALALGCRLTGFRVT
ncbi:hypothetical protein EDD15DRAFT_694594 [Pisolithus albus]|nr:hypothetical protein EDD15DRAFT_694594 [Pisolithus albus]